MPKVEKDFEELLRLFNRHKVRYCIVGAFAVAFHAVSRYTKDLDVFVEPDLENGVKIVAALKEFGFGGFDISPEDFAKKGSIVQLGHEPVRVDLLNAIEGVSFSSVWKNRRKGAFGGLKVFYIGLRELKKNKKTAARRQDLTDLEILAKVKRD